MAKSAAQKKAQAKYQKEKEVIKGVKLNRGTDKDILEWLEDVSLPFTTYIKILIREDIEKGTKR